MFKIVVNFDVQGRFDKMPDSREANGGFDWSFCVIVLGFLWFNKGQFRSFHGKKKIILGFF